MGQGIMILLYGATGVPGGGGIPMRMVSSHPSDDFPGAWGSGNNSAHDQSMQVNRLACMPWWIKRFKYKERK